MEVNFSRKKEKTEHEKVLENIIIHKKKKKITNIFIKYFKTIDQKHLYLIKWKLMANDPIDIRAYDSYDNYGSIKTTYTTNNSELDLDKEPPDTYQMSNISKSSNQNVIQLFQKIIKKNESPNLKLIYFFKWKSMIVGTRTRTFSVKQKKVTRRSVKFVRPSLYSKKKEQNQEKQKEEEEEGEKETEIKDLYKTDDSVQNYESLGTISNLEEEKDIKEKAIILLRKIIQRKISLSESQNGVIIVYFRKWKIICLKQRKESISIKAHEKEEDKDEIKGDEDPNEEGEYTDIYNKLFYILQKGDEVTRKKSRKKLLDIIKTFEDDKGNEEYTKYDEYYNDNITNLDDKQNEIKSSSNSDSNQSIKIK